MIRLRPPEILAWAREGFREVPHALGPELGICLVDIPPEAAAPPVLLRRLEVERALRILDATEASRFLASHALLRCVLADVLGRPPAAVGFSSGEFGKPRLEAGTLSFNMSRSGPVTLIAVSSACEVGVDVELVREVADAEALARRHFSSDEILKWREVDASSAETVFLQCWTRKEACIKAAGVGLAMSLNAVDVGWEEPGHTRSLQLAQGSRRWDAQVCTLEMPQHLVAAAAVVTSG